MSELSPQCAAKRASVAHVQPHGHDPIIRQRGTYQNRKYAELNRGSSTWLGGNTINFQGEGRIADPILARPVSTAG
jgi:hypothetical protein